MKRVTGVVTQGARSVLKPMIVTEFTVSISNDGYKWSSVKEQGTDGDKVLLYLCVLNDTKWILPHEKSCISLKNNKTYFFHKGLIKTFFALWCYFLDN